MYLKQPQITVIMPAYNADRHVRRAVESLQNQTMRDFELLVVDDGSSDRTGQMLDSAASRDYRITVYHNEHAGAVAARNYALERAHGTYVFFMETDDWVEQGMLEDMLSLAEASMLELVLAGFYIDTYYNEDGERTSEVKCRPDDIYPTQQEFRAAAWQLFDQKMLYAPWNKLFLRERIESLGLRFQPGPSSDLRFVLDYVRDVERVGTIEHPYYHFVRTWAEFKTAEWCEDLYEIHEEEHGWVLDLYRHWGLEGDPASMEMVQRCYIERLMDCIENICNPTCSLATREKIARIDMMIKSDRAQVAVVTANPRSRLARTMLLSIKARNARLAYQEGRVISFAKRHNSKAFATLKTSD